MKQPLPTKRTWAERRPYQIKPVSGLSASRDLRLAQAGSRGTLPDPMPESMARRQVQRLEAQAARVNQLSHELRVAMAELKALSSTAAWAIPSEAVSEAAVSEPGQLLPNLPVPAIAPASLVKVVTPPVLPVMSTPMPLLQQARQEAADNAQFLRGLKQSQPPDPGLQLYRPSKAVPSPVRIAARGWRSLEWHNVTTWVLAAIVVRVALKGVLSSYLWAEGLLGVVIAAIALFILHRIWIKARSAKVYGYRFLWVLLGFMIGGCL